MNTRAQSKSTTKMRIIITDAETGELIREHDETGKVVKDYTKGGE